MGHELDGRTMGQAGHLSPARAQKYRDKIAWRMQVFEAPQESSSGPNPSTSVLNPSTSGYREAWIAQETKFGRLLTPLGLLDG